MDITDFDLRNVDLTSRVFHSEVYGRDFPLIAPERTYVKLSELPKPAIRGLLPEFKGKLPGRSLNSSHLDSEEFYSDPNFQQFYTLITQLTPSDKLLYIFFRNAHQDKGINDYLEAMHESAILRQCVDCGSLDEEIEKSFGTQLQTALKESEQYFQQPVQDFEYLGKRKIFNEYTKNRMSMIFDSLAFMNSKGYSPKDFFEIASQNRVYPHFKYPQNALIKTAEKVVL